MTDSVAIPDLWPEELRTFVLTPIAVLRSQAATLTAKTKGLLEGRIETVSNDKEVVHNFDVVAPALDGYAHRLLRVTHGKELVYPARVVTAFSFAVVQGFPRSSYDCVDDVTLMGILRVAFATDEIRSILMSLIARCNDLKSSA